MSSRQMRDGSAAQAHRRPARWCAARTRRRARARGSRLTNSSSPSGSSGRPDLERGGAGAGVEGEEGVVGLGGGDQLGAADLGRAQLAAHQRLAAVGAAVGEVDDRLEVRRHLRRARGTRGTSRCARGRAACRPAIGRPCSSSRRTANRQARSECEIEPSSSLQAVLPAGAGELHALDGDVARRRARSRGARPCRARTDGATAVARRRWSALASRSGFTSAASAGTRDPALEVVTRRRRRPRGRPRPRPPNVASASRRAQSSPSSSETWVSSDAAARPRARACSPGLRRASGGRAGPSRSGRGSVASMISRSVSRANSTSASVGAWSAP